jgi:hypothetical protein
VLTSIEVSALILWWRNETRFLTTWALKRRRLSALWRWMSNFKTEMRVASYVSSIAGCSLYLTSDKVRAARQTRRL